MLATSDVGSTAGVAAHEAKVASAAVGAAKEIGAASQAPAPPAQVPVIQSVNNVNRIQVAENAVTPCADSTYDDDGPAGKISSPPCIRETNPRLRVGDRPCPFSTLHTTKKPTNQSQKPRKCGYH
jgi:hypothetical protein